MKSLWFYIVRGALIAVFVSMTLYHCWLVPQCKTWEGYVYSFTFPQSQVIIAALAASSLVLGAVVGSLVGMVMRARDAHELALLQSQTAPDTVTKVGVWPPAPKRPD